MFASSILGQLNRKNEKYNSNEKVQYVTQVPMAFTADSSPTQDQSPQSNECFLLRGSSKDQNNCASRFPHPLLIYNESVR